MGDDAKASQARMTPEEAMIAAQAAANIRRAQTHAEMQAVTAAAVASGSVRCVLLRVVCGGMCAQRNPGPTHFLSRGRREGGTNSSLFSRKGKGWECVAV